jgi:hypothetical protein
VGSTPDNPDYDTRIYGEWLLIDSMVSDYGVEVVERLWEYVADYEGMDVFYNLADELGVTPQDIVLRMAVRNLLLDYELGGKFFDLVRVEANVNGVGTVTPRQDGVQELGVDYLLITAPGVYTFQIDQPGLRLAVVGVDQASGQANVFDLGNGGTVDTTAFTNAYVLIENTALHSDPAACSFTNWNLTVSDGAGQPTAAPMGEPFDATGFIPAG